MTKECTSCGKICKERAVFCGKCGFEFTPECEACGCDLKEGAMFCFKCGESVENSGHNNPVTPSHSRGKKTHKQAQGRYYNDQSKEKMGQFANTAKERGIGVVEDVRDFRNLPKRKKRNLLIGLGGFVAVFALVMILIFGRSGVSDAVVGEAAFAVVRDRYNYQLELISYDVFDSSTSRVDHPFGGGSSRMTTYLVIIEAKRDFGDGGELEPMTFGVSVIDPGTAGGVVILNMDFSEAKNMTGMETREIKEFMRAVVPR